MLTPDQVQTYRFKYGISADSELTPKPTNSTGTDLAIGAGKGFARGISSAGAQHAGPVGADMLSKAPELKRVLDKVDEQLTTDNGAQEVGAFVGELAIPVGPVASPIAKASRIPALLKAATSDLGEAAGKVAENLRPSAFQSSSIVQRINRITPTKQNEFKKMTGQSVGEYLVDRNIIGTSDKTVTELATRMEKSMGEVDAALSARPELFKPPVMLSALRELEAKAAATSVTGAASPITARVAELTKKLKGEGLTLSEINEAKRLYERNVKIDYVKQQNPEKIQLANNIDSGLREYVVEKATSLGIANVSELNKETQAAKFLIDEIGRASAGRAANNAISLTDWLLLAEGASDPVALAAFLGKKGISSETFQAWVAKKISSGASKVGAPKATIGEVKPTIADFKQEQAFFSELDTAIQAGRKKK